MCLAIPGKVISVDRSTSPLMGIVNFAGIQKQVCLDWVPDVQEGAYVIVHVGFALNTLDEAEAEETLRLLREMGTLDEEIRSLGDSPADGSTGPVDAPPA